MISTLKVRMIIEFQAKSLYRSRAGNNFNGIEYEIWVDYDQLLRAVFSCFQQRQTKLSQFVYFSLVLRELEETKTKYSKP